MSSKKVVEKKVVEKKVESIDEDAKLPPNKSQSKQLKLPQAKSQQANKSSKAEAIDEEVEDFDDVPDLEYVSNSTKERYEYNPVLRSEIVYVHPDNRITSEVMSKFELCEVRSHRAKQIESGLLPFVEVGELTDPLEIANKEIKNKKCPLDIIRVILEHNNMKIAERWHVNEMAIPDDM